MCYLFSFFIFSIYVESIFVGVYYCYYFTIIVLIIIFHLKSVMLIKKSTVGICFAAFAEKKISTHLRHFLFRSPLFFFLLWHDVTILYVHTIDDYDYMTLFYLSFPKTQAIRRVV